MCSSDLPVRAFHALNVPDVEAALTHYGQLCRWVRGPAVDLGPHGVHHAFGYIDGEWVGSMASLAGRPGVHPQWLHHLPVADLGRAVEIARSRGAFVFDPVIGPDGVRVAVGDDPQGGAFAVRGR